MTERPLLVACIPTWRDGPAALGAAVRTALTAADHVIVLDGGIAGVVPEPEYWSPGLLEDHWSFLQAPNVHTYRPDRNYPSEAMKRNELVGYAVALRARWILWLDADEQLHGGQALRRALEDWQGDVYPIAFQPIAGGEFIPAAFKCFRAGRFLVVGPQPSIVVELDADGMPASSEPVQLSGGATPAGWNRTPAFITHHPERRPPDRRHVRLGELEHVEPVAASIYPVPFPV